MLAWNATFRKLRPWHLVPSLHGKWMGKQWKKWQALFFGLQNHCSYEIIRCLLIGRKVMTNLDSILKSRVITLPTNSILSKLCFFCLFVCFSSSHIWMQKLEYKESWVPKNWWFWIVMLDKTLESPLDIKEVQPKGN